jgi:murein DD-endopeptidase MepM/ murein hydrolase activator NlpD
MALNLADRLLTIAVTATLTSAAWIVVGSTYLGPDERAPATASTGTKVQARPLPSPSPLGAPVADEAAGGLAIPVAGVAASQLTDTFGDIRGGGARPHEALDIMAPAGTPVIAAAPGKVEKLFLSKDGGNTVYVRSGDRRTIYYYAHLQAYAPGLREGMQVARGETLGTVGSSGNADPAAPHLHFAIMRTSPEAKWWEPGTPINPYPALSVTE